MFSHARSSKYSRIDNAGGIVSELYILLTSATLGGPRVPLLTRARLKEQRLRVIEVGSEESA